MGKRRPLHGACGSLLLGLCLGPTAAAQEPLIDRLAAAVKTDAISLGALLQVTGEFQDERTGGANGFRVANFRVSLGGNLDRGFGYFFQTNLVQSRPILDAALRYRTGGVTFEGGQFKAPFSRELLTGAGRLDFIERSRVVATLAPGRQVGLQARGDFAGGAVVYNGGLFNGNGTGAANDDNRLLFAGRLAVWPVGPVAGATQRLEVAVNAAYSRDADVTLGSLVSSFAGERLLVGADFRWTGQRTLVAAEFIRASLDPEAGGTVHPAGWHLTLGYEIAARTRLLMRWDGWRPDGLAPDSDLIIAGMSHQPISAVLFRLNYAIDPEDAGWSRHRAQAGGQLAF